ncbi:MAG: hypothetical protein ACRDOT_09205 [Aeromicrobium sp.]
MAEPEADGQESVGSLAQETARLLHALAAEARRPATDGEPADRTHVCTTGWCPICQVVGYVHDHPEVVEQVTDAAVEFGRTLREALERAVPPDRP